MISVHRNKQRPIKISIKNEFRLITLDAKKGSSVTFDCTYEHSTTSGTPLSPFRQASANMAPA